MGVFSDITLASGDGDRRGGNWGDFSDITLAPGDGEGMGGNYDTYILSLLPLVTGRRGYRIRGRRLWLSWESNT